MEMKELIETGRDLAGSFHARGIANNDWLFENTSIFLNNLLDILEKLEDQK